MSRHLRLIGIAEDLLEQAVELERLGVRLFPTPNYIRGALEDFRQGIYGTSDPIFSSDVDFFAGQVHAARVELGLEFVSDLGDDSARPFPVAAVRPGQFDNQLRGGFRKRSSDHLAGSKLHLGLVVVHVGLLFGIELLCLAILVRGLLQ